ncbi:hypothetical protein AGABI2DRAFT_136997 [Agaricus bisporus var. bisporus H97]|uniref:hypothetical protein n=1 Tax=Agaricus bisporus var. bisporus (strain H97 / ATCC MYA-4626 / FGSC 10389) TaxID=936046 RepID=UPI00029F61C8|nr:hypothetical protein AGABI2DRAFT_136997 [Agaricus bisporus var. bisporus H97]EKV46875.1 hypothetical protein AGABI2DRAFT_136997 [Agaricus bisporus var. bisporus H97]
MKPVFLFPLLVCRLTLGFGNMSLRYIFDCFQVRYDTVLKFRRAVIEICRSASRVNSTPTLPINFLHMIEVFQNGLAELVDMFLVNMPVIPDNDFFR